MLLAPPILLYRDWRRRRAHISLSGAGIQSIIHLIQNGYKTPHRYFSDRTGHFKCYAIISQLLTISTSVSLVLLLGEGGMRATRRRRSGGAPFLVVAAAGRDAFRIPGSIFVYFPARPSQKGRGPGNKEITSFLFLLGRADLQESRIHLLFACRPACDMCEHTTTIREQGERVRPVSFSIVRLGLPSASASSSSFSFLSSSSSIRCCLSEIYCHRHEIYRSLPPPSVAVKRRPSEIPLH